MSKPYIVCHMMTVLDGRMEHAVLLEAIAEKSLGTTMEKKK